METINRVLDLFPAEQQKEVRTSFAGALRGIVSQRLVPKADGKGRVPAIEVLLNTGRVFDRIVDPDQTDSIVDVIAEGGYYGMQTFDQALVQLVKEGLVNVDDARRTATSPHDFDLQLAGCHGPQDGVRGRAGAPAARSEAQRISPGRSLRGELHRVARGSRRRSRAAGTRG